MNENEKTTYRKKLIEVALPLDAINKASAREKSIRHGHPSTLHLWWARRPLAAARAVLFAQLVDDPSSHPELFPTEEEQNRERDRLFALIEQMVKWENTNNEKVLEAARKEIRKSWALTCKETGDDPEKLPAFHDPFAGGGAIPLEAQRLGLEAHASDLNPVAVLICKAMLEIPQKFAGQPPVNPESRKKSRGMNVWKGAQGLAEDVRYYGKWMRDEVEKKIGDLYPKVKVTSEMIENRPDLKEYESKELTVIAWIWARTVKSPNPAFKHVHVPLVSSFVLSNKKGKEAWVKPVLSGDSYRFMIKTGSFPKSVKEGTKISRGSFRCIFSGTPIPYTYIDEEANAGRTGAKLMAIVAEGRRGRVYFPPTKGMEKVATEAIPSWKPTSACRGTFASNAQGRIYGFKVFGDYFTSRQLVALSTISDSLVNIREKIIADAILSGMIEDKKTLDEGGERATAYSDSIAILLSLAIDRLVMSNNSLVSWNSSGPKAQHCFGRQALPMVWDFAETNPFASATGSIEAAYECVADPLSHLGKFKVTGFSNQLEASKLDLPEKIICSTDPPYYSNVGYSDLSDFFYVWLRKHIKDIFPGLFYTLTTPKNEELVATPYRHESKEDSETFFLNGMKKAFSSIKHNLNEMVPLTIYYAFKQSEKGETGQVSTGWETFLESLIDTGLTIFGTWPLRTEMKTRQVAMGTNALASSIILVCRKKNYNAEITTRRNFQTQLREKLPKTLRYLQKSNIAPVDLAQSAIGPGMAIFSKYERVIEADGTPMTVRTALELINEVLDEILSHQEGELDSDSRWAVSWFEQFGTGEGSFGVAETLCKAKNNSVQGLVDAGFLYSKAGRVHLLRRDEMSENWDPSSDHRLTVWESTQHLIRVLENEGEEAAAGILKKLGGVAEQARDLAYRLYMTCERKGWAEEARSYNALVVSWPELKRLASSIDGGKDTQGKMFE